MYLKTRVWDVHKRKVVSPWDIVICACSGSYGIANSYEPPEEAERERRAQPCPECGGTGHCLHKELRNMRPDLYK